MVAVISPPERSERQILEEQLGILSNGLLIATLTADERNEIERKQFDTATRLVAIADEKGDFWLANSAMAVLGMNTHFRRAANANNHVSANADNRYDPELADESLQPCLRSFQKLSAARNIYLPGTPKSR